MTLNYQKIWNVMNDLEMVTCKIVSAREILDCAVDRLQEHQYDKAETLMYAVDEYLQYYLDEFDRKFKDAWKETVSKVKQQEIDDCMPPWGHSDMEALRYTDKEMDAMCDNAAKAKDKVVKWVLPVEYIDDECFVSFPEDLLEAANLKEGDHTEWIDQGDGSYLLKKVPKTYDEMVEAGHTMTADGFWIKE